MILRTRVKKNDDPVNDLFLFVKQHDDAIVVNHSDIPYDTWVLGTSQMTADIKRFCTSPLLSMPISINPTFNLGQFDVTPISFHNLFIRHKVNKTYAVNIGHMMIHHAKDFSTYKLFSSSLHANCKIDNICSFVTDGE